MKLSPTKIDFIVRRYHQLLERAQELANLKARKEGFWRNATSVAIEEGGDIAYRINIACHCHPEYRSFTIPAETFFEYLEGKEI